MKLFTSFHRNMLCRLLIASVLVTLVSTLSLAQPKYRTFDQGDLAEKKAHKAGKPIASAACFTFRNDLSITVNSLHAKFNSEILSIEDSGGFPTISASGKKRFDARGRSVAPGDSVTMCITFHKHSGNNKVENWRWDTSGVAVGPKHEHLRPNDSSTIFYKQPNGGTLRDYIYKHVIRRPAGLLVGLPNPTTGGWIRYKTSDRKYFPHINTPRCFDFITREEHGQRPFVGEFKNLHVKKHNNHLLGEVHALKLAVIANDSGVTAPLDASTRLGGLLYHGTVGDPCDGLTIRQIVNLADSALTYCGNFDSTFYHNLDSSVSNINRAFDGPYVALTFHPLTVAGTNALPPWLTPGSEPVIPAFQRYSAADDVPEHYVLQQNYPNPFNPSTTIEFTLSEESIVSLSIYNMLGQEVATLLNREEMEDGQQSVEFEAINLTSGVYFYRIIAQGIDGGLQFQAVKRMLLVK